MKSEKLLVAWWFHDTSNAVCLRQNDGGFQGLRRDFC
jgi:hypothetical protein